MTDKLGVLRSLLDSVDRLIVGGGMAFTFLAAQGHSIGASLFDPAALATCRALLAKPVTGSCCRATWSSDG